MNVIRVDVVKINSNNIVNEAALHGQRQNKACSRTWRQLASNLQSIVRIASDSPNEIHIYTLFKERRTASVELYNFHIWNKNYINSALKFSLISLLHCVLSYFFRFPLTYSWAKSVNRSCCFIAIILQHRLCPTMPSDL